jgi:protein-tyrosine phosphatase
MTGSRVLMVCMGNICRSPTAEEVFRTIARRDAPQLALEVDSAGTHDYHVGDPPDRRSIAAARARGYDLSALRARQLASQDFQRFDYVLVADTQNLGEATRLVPASPRARLQRLLDYAPGQPLRDLPDPYYGGPRDFELVIDLCEQAARGLLQHLQSAADGHRGRRA